MWKYGGLGFGGAASQYLVPAATIAGKYAYDRARQYYGQYRSNQAATRKRWIAYQAKKAVKKVAKGGKVRRYRRGVQRRRAYRRTYYKTKRGKQMKTLQRRVNSLLGTLIYKQRLTGRSTCAVNAINYDQRSVNTITELQAVLTSIPIYDPSNPGTYIEVNYNSGDNQRTIEFISTVSSMVYKNNYHVPVKLRVYLCVPREDTLHDPLSTVTDGLGDIGTGLDETTPMLSPFDSELFKRLYRVLWVKKFSLDSGKSATCSHKFGTFTYDPEYVSTHSSTFQTALGCHTYLVRLEGSIGHDGTPFPVGFSAAGVDWANYRVWTLKYNAGADIKVIKVNDDTETVTNPSMDHPDIEKIQYTN